MTEAKRVVARAPAPTERWSEGLPAAGDLRALESILHATERYGDQGPFGYYQITRLDDGAVICGIGFKGSPEAGQVEIGYGLVPSAQGRGYASEAIAALLTLAGNLGVRVVVADSTPENVASQKTLLNAGFRRTGTERQTCQFAVVLNENGSRD